MSGDFSRDSFDALRDYAGVFLQQGRAVLDADWNEMVQIFERRIRSATVDTIGRAVVPRETMTGFEIRITGANGLEIGRGRMYHDGNQLNCHGAANYPGSGDTDFDDPLFDRAREADDGPEGVLDELISTEDGDYLNYLRQPYWPEPDPLPQGGGPHVVYVCSWKRDVTPIMAPDLLEPAMGGIDTTTRWQTVWQVRVLENVPTGTNCDTPDEDLGEAWIQEISPSTARLTTTTIDIEDPEDPCLIPPTDGYTGLENQFYRVEIHQVGDDQGEARFKFSRENGSVAAAIEVFASPANSITVQRIGRDEILRFRPGDWVEITDDIRELNHRSGQMLRVADVDEDTREIFLEGTVVAPLVPTGVDGDTAAARHSRIIRWDQNGIIRLADESQWADLGAPGSDGLIPVPPDGTAIVLESGITVSFSTADGPGLYREMDAWRFAARTAGTQIKELQEAPPDSVQRHYSRLAVVTFPNSVQDCRTFWPPEFEGGVAEEGCACTVCLTAEEHNSGAQTIQAAIDSLPAAGGTVCLGAGNYLIEQPIVLDGRNAITIQGQGLGTILFYQGGGTAIGIEGCTDIQVQRMSILSIPTTENPNGALIRSNGITVTNSLFVALRRLAIIVPVPSGEPTSEIGIALEGLILGGVMEECLVFAPVAIGSASARDDDVGPGFLALFDLRAVDNILFGARAAVQLSGLAFNLAGVTLTRNLMFGTESGVDLNWFSPPSGSTAVDGNTIISNGDGAILGVSDLRLQDNEISGGLETGNGVRLVDNVAPEAMTDAQIIGNRISELAGHGIRIEGQHGAVLIKRNFLRDCGSGGIVTGPDALIEHIAIDNNVFDDIADAIDTAETSAVTLTRCISGQIVGNSIRAIGRNAPDGSDTNAIAVQGVGTVAIEGNTISQIGPDSAEARATAIVARRPYAQLNIGGNRVDGASDTADSGSNWAAIEIGNRSNRTDTGGEFDLSVRPVVAAEVPGVGAGDLAFVTLGAETVSVSSFGRLVATPVRRSQIAVHDNQMHSTAPPLRPMVVVFDGSASSIGFNQNQCDQTTGFDLAALIMIGAQRIMAGNNSVRHAGDNRSMQLNIGSTGAATPIGNITSGRIEVVPGGLTQPFAALNLIQS